MMNSSVMPLMLLMLLALSSCEQELKDDYEIPGNQAVLFEYHYINHAWGYAENGWLIDSDGNMVSCKGLNELEGNCTKEAVRVFWQIQGKWSPGTESKNLLFPVVFRIGETKSEIEIPEFEMVQGKFMDPIFIIGPS